MKIIQDNLKLIITALIALIAIVIGAVASALLSAAKPTEISPSAIFRALSL